MGEREEAAMAQERIVVVTPGDRVPGPVTPGMDRQQAVATEGMWSGLVRTEPGMVSGWHHHGEHTMYGRVLSGRIEFEFGPAGAERVIADPGDYFVVPPHTVHREGNPQAVEQVVVVVRVGSGPSVINMDGPEAAASHWNDVLRASWI